MLKLRKIFFDILSFGTPQAILFNLTTILTTLTILPTEYLKYSPFRCIFKHFIFPLIFGGICPTEGLFVGCNCPACGMTRAMSRLLHGNLTGAYNFNKLVFLLFPVTLFLIFLNLIKILDFYKKNKHNIK